MVAMENLGAYTVKKTVNDICERESTEVIMDASTAYVKVNEVVEKAEARVVKPAQRSAQNASLGAHFHIQCKSCSHVSWNQAGVLPTLS